MEKIRSIDRAPPRGVVITPPASAPTPPAAPAPQAAPAAAVRLTRVRDTRLAPFASICRITTAKGGVSYGTGILIGPYHVLTCAHVIFPPQDQLTKEIIVFPGQNGPDSHCRVKADTWAAGPAYDRNNCNTPGEDYGIIRLSCPMNPGFVPLRAFNPTTLNPTTLGRATVSLAGYPSGLSEKARHMYFSRGTITGGVNIISCTRREATSPFAPIPCRSRPRPA